ncbi:MAG: sterol desaturase family protein [Alphaproteobacteria bacterium]|nr:sterol desaturase family protein [Alphaproteobacteria bacterium]
MTRMLSYILWPWLFGDCVALNHLALGSNHPIVYFNLIYLGLACCLLLLERVLPFERQWLADDGQIGVDLGHTLLNKGLVQVGAVAVVAMGIAETVDPEPAAMWPTAWPIAGQVILGLVIAECGLYFAHRLAHEWPKLWCFHAVHHSVTRLWVVNTGRFHFVDTMASIALSQSLLYLAGAPKPIFLWVAAITAFIGILTHCNVAMRAGWLNLVFNTPELHRWHHSRITEEGNTNYGENLMFMDLLFRSYFLPNRRPPADIGIDRGMPKTLLGQLRAPFMWLAGERGQPLLAVAGAGEEAVPPRRASDPSKRPSACRIAPEPGQWQRTRDDPAPGLRVRREQAKKADGRSG